MVIVLAEAVQDTIQKTAMHMTIMPAMETQENTEIIIVHLMAVIILFQVQLTVIH